MGVYVEERAIGTRPSPSVCSMYSFLYPPYLFQKRDYSGMTILYNYPSGLRTS